MSDECCLNRFRKCCCTCKWQYIDRSHPGTDGKRTYMTRGYICAEPFLGYHSGWSEHGVCECWVQRPDCPEEIKDDLASHYEVEMWDARYSKRDNLPTWWKLRGEYNEFTSD